MPEPSPASEGPSEIARLLFKAVRTLPEDEQQAVFAYFLERGIGVAQQPFLEPFTHEVVTHPKPQRSPEHGRGVARASVANMLHHARTLTGPNQQAIPVRLSEESHRRLKEWCAEHNFPMAVVVRGLIERFLDGWQERAA